MLVVTPASRVAGRAPSVLFVLLLLAFGSGAPVGAPDARAQEPVVVQLCVLGVNALLGGATAGISAHWHDGSFLRGLGAGALGGSTVWAGKRLGAADAPGAGLAGRMVAAVGASIVRNAAAARGPLDRLIVPVGPLTLYVTASPDSQRVRPKLNLGRSIYLGHLALDEDYEVDWARTLSSGAPVFAGREVRAGFGGADAGGLELLGAISLSDPALLPPHDPRALVAHERVHVLQDDFVTVAWADPVEDWLLERIPGGDVAGRYVDTDLPYLALMYVGVAALPYDRRPWEWEASHFAVGR